MNKSQLIDTIAQRLADQAKKDGVKAPAKADVVKVANMLLEVITDTVAGGDDVQVVGFGTWKRGLHKGGTARNLITGEPVSYGDTWTVSFSAGAGFKSAVKAGPKLTATAA